MWALACLVFVAGCQQGGLVITVEPSNPAIDRIRLYLSTGGETKDASLRPARAPDLIEGVTYWPRDPMNELDHMMVDSGESARFVLVHSGADELTALIAVGYIDDKPVGAATRYNLPIPADADAYAHHTVVLGTATGDFTLASGDVWIEPWSPSPDTPASEASCIGIVDDTQTSFIVAKGDPDCDDYKTDSDKECDPDVYRQNRPAELDEMICLASAAADTSCALGGPPCIDGEVRDPSSCRPSRYCAPLSLCSLCADDLACAQDITDKSSRPTRLKCTVPIQAVGTDLCTQPIEIDLPLSAVTANQVKISDPTHEFATSIQVESAVLGVGISSGNVELRPSGSIGSKMEIGALIAADLSNGRGFAIPLIVTFGSRGCLAQPGFCVVESALVGDTSACDTGWGLPVAVTDAGRHPTLAPDLLEMIYVIGSSIVSARRTTATNLWPPPTTVAEFAGLDSMSSGPELADNGKEIYFSRRTTSTMSDYDIHRAARSSGLSWIAPQPILEIVDSGPQLDPTVDALRHRMVYSAASNGSGPQMLFERARQSVAVPWGPEVALTPATFLANDISPHLSADGLTLHFASDRRASSGLGYELFVAKRAQLNLPFAPPHHIAELGGPSDEVDPWVDPTGRVMFFASDRSGAHQIYEAKR